MADWSQLAYEPLFKQRNSVFMRFLNLLRSRFAVNSNNSDLVINV